MLFGSRLAWQATGHTDAIAHPENPRSFQTVEFLDGKRAVITLAKFGSYARE